MNRKRFVGFFFIIVMVLFSFETASATEIKSYDELFNALPGGIENIETNRGVIEKAQKQVENRQMLRRRRKIKFIKPVDLADINEKYISIAFDVEIQPRKKSVFTLLFEKAGTDRISYPDTIYLSWIGEKDIKLYNKMDLKSLAKSYKDMGIEDCSVEFVRTKVERILSAKSNIGHKHSAKDFKGVIPEKMIDRTLARDSEVRATVGNLELRIAQLEQTIRALNAKLKGVERKGETLVFNGMNVQIINGRGATNKINGRGNLIVGYNESSPAGSRKGSHNIVVGGKNNFSSYGSVVAGYSNAVSGKYSFVAGGNNNVASGDYSTILGGSKNKAKGKYTSINGQTGRTKVGSGQNKHFKK